MQRREFFLGAAAGVLGIACGSAKDSANTPGSQRAPDPTPADKPTADAAVAATKPGPKKILILGGTSFLGPQIVDAARARGHTLTLFNRGKTHADLFPDVEKLRGDRDGKLDALKGRTWDAVVDTSGFVPRIVKMSAELLAPSVAQYIFISSVSVYADDGKVNADETSKLQVADDPKSEEVRKYYGALKARSEEAAEAAMPGRVLNIRPGLIVGRGDPTGRFTHWPARMSDGNDVLCPGDGTTPTQIIDVRDLAEWIVKTVEDRTFGAMNALGPAQRMTMKDMLEGCHRAAGGKGKLVWVDADFLAKQGVQGWSEMPAWFDNRGEMAGFGTTSNARAVAAGLTFRPVQETAADTLAWLATLPADERAKVRSSGIKPDKEAAVLAAWRAKK
ncbi:MAG: NAD-dependent epimerase/dehydratase family protein [Deltaproteobacteria bacterium]|nr:NAD-dependent epimerase/dehydratase family protein [Deltaproteobacteria bacterium]